MKNISLKTVLSILLAVCLVLEISMISPTRHVSAAEDSTGPGIPEISAKIQKSGNAVKITIAKTTDAEGYQVYMRTPDSESFKKIKTIKKDGTKKRTYTKKNLGGGTYTFKVRAYRTVDGTKVYSAYSRDIPMEINFPGSGDDDDRIYADITFKNGYAYFGTYPQVKVTDSSLISALKATPDSDNVGGCEYKGKWYLYVNGNYYEERPIEWIILKGSATSDSVTLMSNKILLECGYSDWSGYESGGKWADSFVRYHLNGYNGSFKNIWNYEFYRIAFAGDTQRVLMDQSYDGSKDKVLLPTKDQLSKLTAAQRVRKASELAQKADKQGYWCIDSNGKGDITLVKPDGTFTTHAAYRQDGEGYVPVIKVNLKKCNVNTGDAPD